MKGFLEDTIYQNWLKNKQSLNRPKTGKQTNKQKTKLVIKNPTKKSSVLEGLTGEFAIFREEIWIFHKYFSKKKNTFQFLLEASITLTSKSTKASQEKETTDKYVSWCKTQKICLTMLRHKNC